MIVYADNSKYPKREFRLREVFCGKLGRTNFLHSFFIYNLVLLYQIFLGLTNINIMQNFVDLAGSERASQTHADGARLREGCHINLSLMTLTTVIRKLRSESVSWKTLTFIVSEISCMCSFFEFFLQHCSVSEVFCLLLQSRKEKWPYTLQRLKAHPHIAALTWWKCTNRHYMHIESSSDTCWTIPEHFVLCHPGKGSD